MRQLVPFLLLAAASASAEPPGSIRLDLSREPAKSGAVIDGADDGRFSWSAGDSLRALFDSTLPSSRLRLPLGRRLTGGDSFALSVELEILGIQGGPDDFMQLALGLSNSETTGLNRTGSIAPPPVFFVDDSDSYDQIELGYFPNVTAFGGPTLQPAVFGGEVGSPFDNFAANFGPSADLGDNGPDQLREWPLARPVRVLLVHDACSQRLITRLFDAKSGEELDAGLAPLDLGFVNAVATFTVDSFSVSLYQDLADPDPSTRSLFADVRLLSASLELLAEPTARFAPAALNPRASGPATLRLEGGAAPWLALSEGRLHGSGGELVELALQRRGQGLVARVDRQLAAEDGWELEVGGCVLPVAPPRRVLGE